MSASWKRRVQMWFWIWTCNSKFKFLNFIYHTHLYKETRNKIENVVDKMCGAIVNYLKCRELFSMGQSDGEILINRFLFYFISIVKCFSWWWSALETLWCCCRSLVFVICRVRLIRSLLCRGMKGYAMGYSVTFLCHISLSVSLPLPLGVMIRHVCWCVCVCSLTFVDPNISNGWRQKLGSSGPPIGNGIWRIDWSHDQQCQVTHCGWVMLPTPGRGWCL